MLISEISVRRPVFATVISLLLIIFGLVSLDRLATREYPDIDRPFVSISTIYRGASAPVIETKITQVIEDAIAGIEGIIKIESDSRDERSDVRIEFDISRDVDAAANDVRDRVSRVLAALPEEADPPQIIKADSSQESVMFLHFSSTKMSTLEVTDYAERYLVDRFSTVPGVARVSINGGRRYAMRIWIDRQALAARRLAVSDIEDALRRENIELPAGRIESLKREFSLRTIVGLETEDDFRNLVIARGPDGHLVRLGEVAKVELAAQDERSFTRFGGNPGVGISIEAQSKGNTLDIVRGVRAELERIRETLPEGASLDVSVDNGISIEAALHEVLIAVIFALISVAFTVMYALGYSINVLTLLGLVLAIGLVVDDAIVVLENIHRRVEMGEPTPVASITGSHEIGFAVIATTLTLCAVFIPIAFLPGDLGRLFREFGLTLAASVLISALVALTLTPMMCSKLMSSHGGTNRFAELVDRFFRKLAERYDRLLHASIRRPWYVLGAAAVVVVIGGLLFRTIPTEFAPAADVGRVFISIEGPEGASMEYMEEQTRQLEAIVNKEMEKGDIERVMIRVPGMMGGGGDVNSARAILILKDWSERERSAQQITQAVMQEVRKMPGVRAFAGQPSSLGRRGFGAPVQAVIGGPDYESLAQWSEKMVQLAQANPGLQNVDTNWKERKPQLKVSVDRNRAADLGVSLQTVGRTLETVLGSRMVTTFVDRGREYNVILQASDDERRTITDLTNIHVRSGRSGELIPLSNVVKVEEAAGAVRLGRFNRLRAIKISADLAPGYTMGEAVKWFEETVARELPPGAALMFDGESGEYIRSGQQLYFTFVFALAVVFLVLAAQFESFVHPLIIMTTVPLAVLGAVFGLKIAGISVNIFSQIAVVLLIGLAAKNGVLIVEFANQLRDRGVEFYEAIVKGAVARLRPVLMTSLCTAFGAIPFLVATGAGAEQRRPIGVVVFYGVMVSMLLTLLVVPAVYSLFARNTKSPQYVSRMIDKLFSQLGTKPAATPASGDVQANRE
jgi:multidrug efflux pump